MVHAFDVEIAQKYGLHEAIILENLHYWIKKNAANEKNWHDGMYWTYNSGRAFREIFPYMSNATIRRALESLEEQGLIVTGNYNRVAYDRTKWYALTAKGLALFGEKPAEAPTGRNAGEDTFADFDKCICSNQQMDSFKTENGFDDSSKPIPNNKPDIKQNKDIERDTRERPGARNAYSNDFEEFWKTYPRRTEKAEAYRCYQARLKDGYSPAELEEAAKRYADQCRRDKTEQRYTKQPKTFLGPNMPFLDFLDGLKTDKTEQEEKPAQEQDEAVMEQFRKLMGIST